MTRKLTDKQALFVQEYLIDLNATQAAKRAGYSERRAKEIGWQLLHKPTLRQAIQQAMDARAHRTQITADRVLLERARIAFSDMRTFAEWGASGVTLKESDTLSIDDAACVAEVSQTVAKEGGSIRFKLHDKDAALRALERHLGLDAPIKVAETDTQGNDLEPVRSRLRERLTAMAQRVETTNGHSATFPG